LEEVLKTLKNYNVLLNENKSIIRTQRLDFLGFVLTPNGIQPSDEKIAALQSFRSPQTTEEVRSFLGFVTFVGRFIPNLARITEPLRDLLKK
jgi:hypothetical protein